MSLYLGTQKVTPTIPAPPSEITITQLNASANGTYTAPSGTAYSPVNVNVPSVDPPVADAVRFYDYDGTILHTYTAADFLELTEMPTNPSHTGLVAQGWNWTLSDAKDFVEDWECLDIGQMYTTSSGDTEIDITLYQGRLAPYLGIAVKGTVSIDWGDNSTPSTLTGTSLTSQIRTKHIYSTPGNYTISISCSSGNWTFYGTSTYPCLNANNSTGDCNKVYASAVQAIRIGTGINSIGNYGFYSCRNLKYITLPNSLLTFSSTYVFSYCHQLKFITLPSSITTFTTGNYTFMNDYNLISVSLPKNFNFLGSSMFSSCYSLESLIFPENVNMGTIGIDSSFDRLERYIVPYQNIKNIVKKETDINKYLLSTDTIINASKFQYNTHIKNCIIPNNINTIDRNAFYKCTSLCNVTIPTSGLTLSAAVGGTGEHFRYCSSLKTINNFNKLVLNGSYIFDYCYALTGPLTCLSTIQELPGNTFEGCSSLESITLPTNLQTIKSLCFSGCLSLTSINIPSTVTTIESSVFSSCYSLSSIILPSSINSIGSSAFNNCRGLGEIHVQATEPPTLGGSTVFSNLSSDCVIYVPTASLSAYQTATNWSTYASQMVGE